jgi:serine/alanine adding enzyme
MQVVSEEQNSGYKIINDSLMISEAAWEAFVQDHPAGSIFQSPDIVRFYEATEEYKPVTLFAIDKDGRIAGVMVAHIISGGGFLRRRLTSRAIATGGPLIRRGDESAADTLIRDMTRKVQREVNYIQIRNLNSTADLSGKFTRYGYAFEEHLNVLIDLTKTLETLKAELHPARRKQINRAVRRGVEVAVQDNPDGETLNSCYSILSSVYKKAGLPIPSTAFFTEAFSVLGKRNRLKVFLAMHNERIIGFRYALVYKDVIYDWFAGSRPEYNDKYPNDILPWSIIKWGREHGFKIFDFGGAGHPAEKYGVRDYKLKFGGSTVNFGRYLHIFRPLVYYPAKYYLKLKKR